MTNRDSVSYIKFLRICKKHLQWIGLSEAARDILSVLLTEYYWSNEALSPEELASITGYSRGSISVAISQLRSLGFIETRVDTNQEGRGRRPTLYALSEGLSGLIMFGIRRLGVELEGILNETNAMQVSTDKSEKATVNALAKLTREAKRNADQLREYTRMILSTKVLEESSPGQETD
jgi:DNA-binding transcriptional ArsR family regulator